MDADGRALLARRPDNTHQGGKWEFPGGKVELGESSVQALARELQEELGIRALDLEPLIRIRHRYAERAVLLDVWKVTRYQGTPHGLEGQPLAWAEPERLRTYEFPAANRPIVKALTLPDTYLVTPEPDGHSDHFLACLETALAGGMRLVQLRAKHLPAQQSTSIAGAAIRLCHGHGARLVVNAAPERALALAADGAHLTGARLAGTGARPLPEELLVGVSCHGLEDLARAAHIDADFAVLGPVKPTLSHPVAPALGWARFSECCEYATLPVYALGGMTPGDIPEAKRRGGQGIAAIRGLWPTLE